MKPVLFCIALFICPAFGQDPSAARSPAAVYVQFSSRRVDVSVEMRRETTALLAPLGYQLEWRDTSTAGHEAWADLAIVTFHGHCRLEEVPFPRFVPGPLGWTDVEDGNVQRFAQIDCDRIAALLQYWLPPRDAEAVFQRAIGRVLAHELYHIFTRTVEHVPAGAAKAEFTPADLISRSFHFQKPRERAMRASAD